jgi:23S rRNA A1618 N6-methylase RlmF
MESCIHLQGLRKPLEKEVSCFLWKENLESKFVKQWLYYIRTLIIHSFEFKLCNPPFYTSVEEVAKSANLNEKPYAVSIFAFDSANSEQHSSRYVQELKSR